MNKIYFIVGNGRSGTNWLAQIIDQHPDVFATIEHPDIFPIVTECALDQRNKRERMKPVFDLYRKYASEHKIYLDKSHPNLWHMDLIREEFPEAKFIGIQRDVYGCVASMMQHEGCRSWCERWRDFPLPNSFLGISERTSGEYDKMPLLQKCVWRWQSHTRELHRNMRMDTLGIEYKNLVFWHRGELNRVANFTGIELDVDIPKVSNVFKWCDYFKSTDLLAIEHAQRSFRRHLHV